MKVGLMGSPEVASYVATLPSPEARIETKTVLPSVAIPSGRLSPVTKFCLIGAPEVALYVPTLPPAAAVYLLTVL